MSKWTLHFEDSKTRRKFQQLEKDWHGCKRCPLSNDRTSVVHCRGTLPAVIAFVGEAPGESEDLLGFPFVGPAGDRFEEMWAHATGEADFCPSFVILNIVACIPIVPEMGGEIELRRPTKQEADKCRPRLRELIQLARPHTLITLGAIAKSFLPLDVWPGKIWPLIHPAAILRKESESPHKAKLLQKTFTLDLIHILETVSRSRSLSRRPRCLN